MKKVVIRRLCLEGFGPFFGAVEAEFGPGINHLVAENERGKSTLVHGLLAVIYGMPQGSDPSRFTQARFRNRDNPARFRGEVDLVVNGTLYRLERDFDDNRVRLLRIDDERIEQRVVGIHNPGARKRNEHYEEVVADLLGIADRETFESTFCVRQPIPRVSGISARVQQLLSGGGGAFDDAISGLARDLEALTRYTGDRGVTPRNRGRDRQLEDLDNEIRDLRDRTRESRTAVDSLEKVRTELAEVEEALGQRRQQLRARQHARSGWGEWRRLRDRYRGLIKEQARVQQAQHEAGELQQRSEQLRESIAGDYPEFQGLPDDAEERLDELVTLDETLTELEDEHDARVSELCERRVEMQRKQERLTALLPWDRITLQPLERVRNVRAAAEEILREWEEFSRMRRRAECLRTRIASEYGPLEEACEADIGVLDSYQLRMAALQEAEQEAGRNVELLEDRVEDHRTATDAFDEEFGDLASLDEGSALQVEERLEMIRRTDDLRDEIRRCESELDTPVLVRLLVAAAAAVGIGAPLHGATGADSPTLLAVFILVLGLLGYTAAGRLYGLLRGSAVSRRRELLDALEACRARAAAIDENLGEFASEDPVTLARLRERLTGRDRRAAEIEELEASLPTGADIDRADTAHRKALDDLREYRDRTERFRRAFGDVERALARWREFNSEYRRLLQEQERFCERFFGCAPEEVCRTDPGSDGVNARWRETVELVRFAGRGSCGTPGDLVEILRDTGDEWWDGIEQDAADYSRLVAEIAGDRNTVTALGDAVCDAARRLSDFRLERDEMGKGMEDVLSAAGGDPRGARARFNEWSRKQRLLRAQATALDELLRGFGVDSMDELRQRAADITNQAALALNSWEGLLEKYPGLPEISRAEEVAAVSRRLDDLDSEIEGLQEKIDELEAQAAELVRSQARLEGSDPLNIARAETELHFLEEEYEETLLLADSLTVAHEELLEAVREFQGESRENLQNITNRYFRSVTGVDNRRVIIGDDFSIAVEEGGAAAALEQLSQGASDQLYLSLRFAVADLVSAEVGLPFVFDDPFVSCDRERRQGLWQVLEEQADHRQFIILSHSDEFSRWGDEVQLTEK